MWQIYHPLLDQPPIDRAALQDCSDGDAAALWDAAELLAGWRVRRQRRATAAIDELLDPPWGGHSPAWIPPPAALLPSDMARALIAMQPALIHRLVNGSEDTIAELSERWSTRLATAREEAPAFDLPLDRYWGRRWALSLRLDPDRTMDPLGVLAGLSAPGLATLAELTPDYQQGLLLRSEALQKLMVELAMAVRWCPTEVLPPAWLERGGLMAALDTVLVEAPGAAVICEAGPRQELADAWALRHAVGDVPHAIGQRTLLLSPGPFWRPEGTWHHRDAPGPGYVLTLTHRALGWLDDPGADGAFHAAALARLTEVGERVATGELRLLVTTTPSCWARLLEVAPSLSALRRLEHPPLDERSLLAAWLCQQPAIEDTRLAPWGLEALLTDLSCLDPADRWRIDQPLIPAPQHHRRIRLLLSRPQPPERMLQRLHKHAGWTRPLVPDVEHLTELLDLTGRLALPC